MKGILLVSHGNLAMEMKNTVELFSGKAEQFEAVSLLPSQEIKIFEQSLQSSIDQLDSGQGVVVFCDLAFGTPCNLVGKMLGMDAYKSRLRLITGMNLPMILEYLQTRQQELKSKEIIQVGKDGIFDFNERIG